ncbi:hypothetical protein [Peribacillus muralis]|uniref:hypothetical protein n=1 Tax=Peribacillus muralis TaxID=264697 RepID=UPI003D04DBFE
MSKQEINSSTDLIEVDIKKYNQVKISLLKTSKCIECCVQPNEKELYQNIAIEYSKELKLLKNSLEDTYDLKLCSCCFENNQEK